MNKIKYFCIFLIMGMSLVGCANRAMSGWKNVNNKPDFLYFGATWCGPCKKMKTLFKDDDVKKELDKYNFVMYDVDMDKSEARKHRVEYVPTMIFLKSEEGSIINLGRYVGGKNKQELLAILRKHLKKHQANH